MKQRNSIETKKAQNKMKELKTNMLVIMINVSIFDYLFKKETLSDWKYSVFLLFQSSYVVFKGTPKANIQKG